MKHFPAPPEARESASLPSPLPSTVAGGEGVLGPRIAAALIDLAILFVLSVVLGALKSEASRGDGTFSYHISWYLDGAALALFLVLAFLYYFALEATIGRTVGKLLVGLQVVGPGQRRPSVWAVAVRTTLRVLDWLPLLYLVGLATTLATGAHRQRVGDLAAKTTVARARPIRRRGQVAGLLASCLLLAFVTSLVSHGVGGRDYATFRADGVSFEYPADWQDFTGDIAYESGGAQEIAAIGPGERDFAVVATWQTNRPVTSENLDVVEREIRQDLHRSWRGWTLQAGPEVTTMGGLPSVRYELEGVDVETTLLYAFDDLTAYQLMCQSTPENEAEIEQGCKQIIRTFQVD
jgi:uncharacterized RDD family membrane protein YckC